MGDTVKCFDIVSNNQLEHYIT